MTCSRASVLTCLLAADRQVRRGWDGELLAAHSSVLLRISQTGEAQDFRWCGLRVG